MYKHTLKAKLYWCGFEIHRFFVLPYYKMLQNYQIITKHKFKISEVKPARTETHNTLSRLNFIVTT